MATSLTEDVEVLEDVEKDHHQAEEEEGTTTESTDQQPEEMAANGELDDAEEELRRILEAHGLVTDERSSVHLQTSEQADDEAGEDVVEGRSLSWVPFSVPLVRKPTPPAMTPATQKASEKFKAVTHRLSACFENPAVVVLNLVTRWRSAFELDNAHYETT